MGFNEDYSELQRTKIESYSLRGVYNLASQRFAEFAKEYFGQVDQITAQERKEARDLGFSVVFSQGLSHKQVLEVLSSSETTRILARS